jgi:hypothetical protein
LGRRFSARRTKVAVSLAAGGPHCRTLSGVERAELDTGMIRCMRHEPACGVGLADQMILAAAAAADGRVAAYLPQGFQVVGEQ